MPETSTSSIYSTIDPFVAKYRDPNTIRAYRADLRGFVTWLYKEKKYSLIADLPRITYEDCETYMHAGDGFASSTRGRKISSMRKWFQYLGQQGYIVANPAIDLETPKLPELLPHPPSAARMERLLDAFDQRDAAWPARDNAILEVLYATGAGSSDLCALDLADVNWDTNSILVGGKRGRGRLLSLNDPASETLRSYLSERAGRLSAKGLKEDATPALLLNSQLRGLGEPSSKARLTTRSLQRIARRIEPAISPKDIRMSCGTHMAENGAGIEIIRAQLGYVGFGAAGRIKRAAATGQREAMKLHPRAQFTTPGIIDAMPEKANRGRLPEPPMPNADKVGSTSNGGPPREQSTGNGIRIELPGGVIITFEKDTDPALLQLVMEKLRLTHFPARCHLRRRFSAATGLLRA